MRRLAESKSRFFLLCLLCVRPCLPHSGVLHWVSIMALCSWVWRFLQKHQRVTLVSVSLLLAAGQQQRAADHRCCATKSLGSPAGRTKPAAATVAQSHFIHVASRSCETPRQPLLSAAPQRRLEERRRWKPAATPPPPDGTWSPMLSVLWNASGQVALLLCRDFSFKCHSHRGVQKEKWKCHRLTGCNTGFI